MRRWVIAGVALVLASSWVRAAALQQGVQELGLSGLIDFDTPDDTLVDIEVSYGYFVADYLEVGGKAGITDDERSTFWGFGGFVEYNFETNTPLIPYVGASLGWAGGEVQIDPENDENNSALLFGLEGGAKYFLTETVALTGGLAFDVASDDVFPSDDGVEDINWDLRMGIRFFF